MGHWFAADELSRGLYGETSRATLRDRRAGLLASQSAHDESAEHMVDIFSNLRAPAEKLEFIYADAAPGLKRARNSLNA
eukprot:3897608-Pyramimonas_sp.AAC.1